ncbi:GPW/gp25 family protein [Novosphingobium sp. 9]|uniref:GPW/gp25 family protein n=1 Tax=Novosphingobium sp. 9 TaxID=2025349 RepID=UPI0021B63CF5|nr:GPW/gp25 family protein [Novosphingobium sp. 9]
MKGIDATSGKAIDGTAHLAQSIGKILTTPLGSRVMLRDFGSMLPRLIDRPGNAANVMLLRAATALALKTWEPRIAISKVTLSGNFADGTFKIGISGKRTDTATNAETTLSIPISN